MLIYVSWTLRDHMTGLLLCFLDLNASTLSLDESTNQQHWECVDPDKPVL